MKKRAGMSVASVARRLAGVIAILAAIAGVAMALVVSKLH